MRHRISGLPPVALAGGALAGGFGGLYLGALLLTGGEIEAGTSVRGVDIGGLTREDAARKLTRDLAGTAHSQKLTVKVGERTGAIDLRSAGFGYDIPRTVDRAHTGGADPVSAISRLFRSRGGDIQPVVRVDEQDARASLRKLATSLDQKVREGSVAFDNGRVKNTTPRTGHALNADAALDTLRTSFIRGPKEPVTVLPARRTEPKVGEREVRRAVRDFARPAMSAPVTLTAGDERFTIDQAVLGTYLTMRPDDSARLEPHLDADGLRADPAVTRSLARLPARAENAELRLDGDAVEVTDDGRAARSVTAQALAKAVMPLLTESGTARTGEVTTRTVQPEVTRQNAARLGLTEKMSSFTVDFEPAPYRTTNIARAVELINGSVVSPGETWSFNRTVGERTEANGFVDGVMILDDQYTKAPGGGVSAVATTVFNAMFFAGLKPVEYGAHSFYIERYPEGREATVAWGSLDLRFLNDSGNTVYLRAESTSTSVTVSFIGTRKYDEITSVKGPRTNIKEPTDKVSTSEECVPQTPLEGFDVTVERVFHDDGREARREQFRTHYTPRNGITCDTGE
ncbi:VanW family protein [Streptomyces sp. DH24]|uniref:VanW family protein n=1 Tax=Streptomyces sp. DH24 TaxID=3040123 RepID=UPI002442D405|nr:VanW family protein [Streptomyces sp. DH24]MDG9718496.1 VanW family protein [Streptomyces sp. DH24]